MTIVTIMLLIEVFACKSQCRYLGDVSTPIWGVIGGQCESELAPQGSSRQPSWFFKQFSVWSTF